ncbi:NADP-dependent oxidoreductase domain-containing protein [Chiua virens]|nr:NADP-dependent oxidoreductase domain-containing protein [Chiua virens]
MAYAFTARVVPMSPRIKLVLGAAQFGRDAYPLGAKVNTVEDAQNLVNLYVSYGHDKLDSSRIYGTSEEIIGELDLKRCTVDTKVHPMVAGGLEAEKVKESLVASVKALGRVKIQTLYLHAPDRTTPIEETLRAVNDLYKEGLFEELGLSQYSSWEVTEVACIADKHGWVKPTVYQGRYNVIERTIEPELLPCLRHFGIRFYAYSPLASGILAGRILTEEDAKEAGGRWDPKVSIAANSLQQRYIPMLPTVRELKGLLEENNMTLSEAALRWLQHHSGLDPAVGDRVIIGASNLKQLESVLRENDGGPLSEEIVDLLNSTWLKVKPVVRYYSKCGRT